MSIALFAEPIKVWARGKRYIWLGITRGLEDGEEWAILNDEDGHIKQERLSDIVTEWHWDPKHNRWADVSEPAEEDES